VIERNSYMYLKPKGMVPTKDHAQCRGCMMFTGDKNESCTAHAKSEGPIRGVGSCGGYAEGKPHPEMAGKEMGSWTKEESGYVEHPVRCENCKWAMKEKGEHICGYFRMQNEMLPECHDIDEEIEPKACCNFQESKDGIKGPKRRGQVAAVMVVS
jgi:hypothetical protein